MRLYLVRHAHALTEDEEGKRPLSEKGRAVARRVGLWLRGAVVEDVAMILHSPLERARETAQIVGKCLGALELLREVDGLLPEDDPAAILPLVDLRRHSLLIVGHEPHLGRLVSLLLIGDADHPLLLMKKGAVVCLRSDGESGDPWVVEWAVKPKLLGDADED